MTKIVIFYNEPLFFLCHLPKNDWTYINTNKKLYILKQRKIRWWKNTIAEMPVIIIELFLGK